MTALKKLKALVKGLQLVIEAGERAEQTNEQTNADLKTLIRTLEQLREVQLLASTDAEERKLSECIEEQSALLRNRIDQHKCLVHAGSGITLTQLMESRADALKG